MSRRQYSPSPSLPAHILPSLLQCSLSLGCGGGGVSIERLHAGWMLTVAYFQGINQLWVFTALAAPRLKLEITQIHGQKPKYLEGSLTIGPLCKTTILGSLKGLGPLHRAQIPSCGAGLKSNRKTVGYSCSSQATISPVNASGLAGCYGNMEGPALGKTADLFSLHWPT